MEFIKYLSMTLAFFLELCMLAALGWWGFQQGGTTLSKYAIAGVLVLVASVLWGIFAAPKSKRRLPIVPRLFFQFAMFLTAAFLLYLSGETTLAIWFAVLALLSTAGSAVFKF
ncbi:MAG: YrdB family protein [Ferruginibacter sp.]